ncbi:uncharacterized protein B0I36DRAFT_351806 [Microdochium trichocladiopsis]|uniref:Uncharacterized protein n=1 Tax=Microdochium trichocladiopsis TaxID=1682393 RepID=A0A9P8XZQ9_9PEZI|nr:uncharacterized protein B0I36DRAFT_351806 [Microdochium trichocladiopsis]KAH7025851.1 hypothetical protein B0I36DRAFT_351806 [Microdochium trichocladiopsis]
MRQAEVIWADVRPRWGFRASPGVLGSFMPTAANGRLRPPTSASHASGVPLKACPGGHCAPPHATQAAWAPVPEQLRVPTPTHKVSRKGSWSESGPSGRCPSLAAVRSSARPPHLPEGRQPIAAASALLLPSTTTLASVGCQSPSSARSLTVLFDRTTAFAPACSRAPSSSIRPQFALDLRLHRSYFRSFLRLSPTVSR